MGFEAPFALLGLLAVALPVLAHFVRRRELPLLSLPTLLLLERARARSRRRMQLIDVLLLVSRILLIALLAIGAASPFLRTRIAYGDGRVASVAIVLDDSMSMGRRDGSQTLLEQAVSRISHIIDALPADSEVAIVLAGSPVRTLVPRTSDLRSARARLEQVMTTALGTDVPTAIAHGQRELAGAHHDTRRLVVLTDGARHAQLGAVRWPAADIDVSIERIGGEVAANPNRGVSAAVTALDPTTPGKASIRVEARQFGAAAGQTEMRFKMNGRELARVPLTFTNGVARATVHAPVADDGDPTAYAEITDNDPLATDDRRGVLLRSAASTRVLIVDGDPHTSRDLDEVGFLTRALELAPGQTGSTTYRVVDPGRFTADDLATTDVLVLANVPAPDAALATRISEFVARGGGLFVAPGEQLDARTYATRFRDALPARISVAPAGSDLVGIIAPLEHVVTPNRDVGLLEVRVHRRLLFPEVRATSVVPLQFSDRTPALVIGNHGAGRSAILATTIDDDWTDLPYRPGFLPLMARLIEHLAPGGSMPDEAFIAGATVAITAPPGATKLNVISPSGAEHMFEGGRLRGPVEFDATHEAGAYRVQASTRTTPLRDVARAAFLVVPPLEESDLSLGPIPKHRTSVGMNTPERGTVLQRPVGVWFFVLAALAAIAEAILRARASTTRSIPARSA